MYFSLCNELVLRWPVFRRRKLDTDVDELSRIVQHDMINGTLDLVLMCNLIIEYAVNITQSRHVILCVSDGQSHRVLAMTTSTWDASSVQFYHLYRHHPSFHNRFLRQQLSPRYSNTYKRATPEGHPEITRYLVVPRPQNSETLYLMLCNKKKNYTRHDLHNAIKLADIAALVYRVSMSENNKLFIR